MHRVVLSLLLLASAGCLRAAERRTFALASDDFPLDAGANPQRLGTAPEMTIAREEIFGPVLSVMRVKTLDEAIELVNHSPYGNATAIFTASGKSAREYSSRCEVGMVGVNVGVAAPMAFFPFAGWKHSFFGDLHAHGKDAVAFYTEQKAFMRRWF